MAENIKVVATNRKAGFEYFLLDHFEAGLALHGSEIKSIRAGQVSLAEAFVEVDGRNAWLVESHIAPYEQANRFNHDPKRKRRLLLHRKEILELWDAVRQKGVTIVPLRKLHDKRAAIAKRDEERELNRQERSPRK
jgi:SsrA-binding protein